MRIASRFPVGLELAEHRSTELPDEVWRTLRQTGRSSGAGHGGPHDAIVDFAY